MRNNSTKSIIITVLITLFFAVSAIGCGSKTDAVSQKMIDDIDALGEITLDDEDEINKLIDRYSTLTDSQKETVVNYATLLEAQDKIELLKENQVAELEKYTQELLAEENVQVCLGIVRDIKSSLKHPDSLELKKILNRDYVALSGLECTEFYIEYEAANDVGGTVNNIVFATVTMSGNFKGHVSLIEKDRGLFSNDYDSEAEHWQDVINNAPDEIKYIDALIIQNNV